jgi:hypothetical protein
VYTVNKVYSHIYSNMEAQEVVYAELIAWVYAVFGYRGSYIKTFYRICWRALFRQMDVMDEKVRL